MSKTNIHPMYKPNQYQKQLNDAIDATRSDLLTELNQAQAARTTALSARDYAANDKWAAYKEMGLNEQVLTVASRIEEMAARAQLLARNLNLFATEAQSDAAQAQSDMAEAAAAVKNAASAMEALTRGIHSAAAVTKSKDAGDQVNEDAIVANAAVELSMTEVDNLQTQSLSCSIIAATPLAASVAQTFSVLGDQVATLIADTTKARDAARQEVAATTATRNQTWSRFYTQIPPVERQLQIRTGLQKSFDEIDQRANFGLKVSISNKKPHGDSKSQVDQNGLRPCLLAEVTLPVETLGSYQTPVFYAVKALDAPSFSFSSSSKKTEAEVRHAAKSETKPHAKDGKKGGDDPKHVAAALPADGTYHAHLLHDHKGDPIQFGETYRIFMRQDLAPEAGAQDLPRRSLPSQPIISNFSFEKNPAPPTLLRLKCDSTEGPADPLLAVFTLPAPPPDHVSYRMIIVPAKLWNSHLEDEQFLIERANPAIYARLDFTLLSNTTKKGIEHNAEQIAERFAADLKILLPVGDQSAAKKAALQTIKAALNELGADALSRTALVYYSPVHSPAKTPPAQGEDEAPVSVLGDYLDMHGGLINLSNDAYKIGVLAWLDDPQTATTSPSISALVGESKPIGVRTPHYEGSGPVEPEAPAATNTPAA